MNFHAKGCDISAIACYASKMSDKISMSTNLWFPNGNFSTEKNSNQKSDVRKAALAVNLFSSAHLERILSLLIISLNDYMDLLAAYVLSVPPEIALLSRFLRLIRFTESYFELNIHSDWMLKMRQKCLEANPLNGLLFTSIMFFHHQKKEFQEPLQLQLYGLA